MLATSHLVHGRGGVIFILFVPHSVKARVDKEFDEAW